MTPRIPETFSTWLVLVTGMPPRDPNDDDDEDEDDEEDEEDEEEDEDEDEDEDEEDEPAVIREPDDDE